MTISLLTRWSCFTDPVRSYVAILCRIVGISLCFHAALKTVNEFNYIFKWAANYQHDHGCQHLRPRVSSHKTHSDFDRHVVTHYTAPIAGGSYPSMSLIIEYNRTIFRDILRLLCIFIPTP